MVATTRVWLLLFAVPQSHVVIECGHPASYLIGMMALPPGVKRPGSEADHSLLSSAEFKNS
jgi:hypothetical protein